MTSPIDSLRQFYAQAVLPLQEAVVNVAEHVVDVADDVLDAAYEVGSAVADGASDVAEAVDDAGVFNVAADLAQHNVEQVSRILSELNARTPESFVDWLIGPDGPSVADFTAHVPGLQTAIGDVIDAAMQNPLVAGAAGRAFGFEYVPGGDFYTTNESSVQSIGGFHEVYDKVGDLLGMDLDDKVVAFEHGGVDYRLEFWQGSYGSGGAFGGEIGLYTRNTGERGPLGDFLEQNIDGYYSSAGGDDQIVMTQTIYDTATGDAYFSNAHEGADDGAHYWNLAIRTDPGVNHENIGQRGSLEVPDADLAQVMLDAMIAEGMDAQLDGNTITYDWP